MGCDIHSYAEMKDRQSGKWVMVHDTFPLTEWEKEFYEKYPLDGERAYRDGPFEGRNYGVFAFLAGVRNYSDVTPLSAPRGLPDDVSEEVKKISDEWGVDGHSHSWLDAKELLEFDYDAQMEDRRITVEVAPNFFDGGRTAKPGGGALKTWREFLSDAYFRDLSILRQLYDQAETRVVFFFDN